MSNKIKYLKLKATEYIPLNFHYIEVVNLDFGSIKIEELPFTDFCAEYNGNMFVGSTFYKANSIIILPDETR
jgi:hypothetical protein